MGQLVAAIGEHPQRLELTIRSDHSQTTSANRDDCDRVRVQGIGLAVVAGVEEPHPCSQLRWNIHHLLAGFDQALSQRTPGAVGALDRPDPVGPLLHITP